MAYPLLDIDTGKETLLMLLTHAVALAEARSYIAALADRARSSDAAMAYERVLLELDWIHDDVTPGIRPVPSDESKVLFTAAESAIEELTAHGADALRVELVLDMLANARALDIG